MVRVLRGEIAAGLPAALTLGCADAQIGRTLQTLFSGTQLRFYLSDDVIGVQLGGALKNVIALAAGLNAGADLGASAGAALITRGMAELSRLAVALGARRETLAGYQGLAIWCYLVPPPNRAISNLANLWRERANFWASKPLKVLPPPVRV